MLNPSHIYINWASYDELSDKVELTEEIAMKQLGELLRLRSLGMRLDYYMMDAFWYDPASGYRKWRAPHWKDEGAAWLEQCRENDVLPGLWFASNTTMDFCGVKPYSAWEDSLNRARTAACYFEGSFWPHMLETYGMWYDKGIRLYKIDFSNLHAATPTGERKYLPTEIWQRNLAAMVDGIKSFRSKHSEARFIAYNGCWENFLLPPDYPQADLQGNTSLPVRKIVDAQLLEAFDTIYCGDPRPADVPAMNFWRSKDVYTDHMVRVFLDNGLPMNRLDNAGFMIGRTGTCYFRGTQAWQGMAILSYARGGAFTTIYGNLDLLDSTQAKWFARVQELFGSFHANGSFEAIGGWPGSSQPYGYIARDAEGAVITCVNPSQLVSEVTWPELDFEGGRLLFADKGFVPQAGSASITLGPEQMAVVGVGKYARGEWDFGIQEDVVIPQAIEQLPFEFVMDGLQTLRGTIVPPRPGVTLRLIFEQFDRMGIAQRTSGGSPPDGVPLGTLLRIHALQHGKTLPVHIEYDKAIWSGLSWAVGEIQCDRMEPVHLTCTTTDVRVASMKAAVYLVN